MKRDLRKLKHIVLFGIEQPRDQHSYISFLFAENWSRMASNIAAIGNYKQSKRLFSTSRYNFPSVNRQLEILCCSLALGAYLLAILVGTLVTCTGRWMALCLSSHMLIKWLKSMGQQLRFIFRRFPHLVYLFFPLFASQWIESPGCRKQAYWYQTEGIRCHFKH